MQIKMQHLKENMYYTDNDKKKFHWMVISIMDLNDYI